MLLLRLYGPAGALTEVGEGLESRGAARNIALAAAVGSGHAVLTAEVQPGAADAALEYVLESGVAEENVSLARLDDVGPIAPGRAARSLIWADVLGQATRNARPVARYLVFMMAAGVIAAFGVIYDNSILIVGAMAVSPDMLPITATCVAVVSGRGRLALRAFATLAIGLATACLTAAALTAVLDLLDALPSSFEVGATTLSGLTKVNSATVVVALVAGIAGMLALETRASAAVGVAISITTIPAAAYFGVALGEGEAGKVLGAAAVLGVNVAMILIGGTATLIVQRRLAPGARPRYSGR